MTPLILHYAPDNASLIVRITLEELDLPYETRLVDRTQRAQATAAYRAVNPVGLIPALETSQGVLYETAAILLRLTETYGKMAPAPQEPGRGDFLKWLVFCSNTVHPMLRMSFYPSAYVGPDKAAQQQLRRKLQSRHPVDMTLPRALTLLDAHFAAHPGPAGADPTVLHVYAAAVLRWVGLYPLGKSTWFNLNDYPALEAMACRLEDRPSVQAVARAEGLGVRPFSAPQPPNPPEGSAL